MLKKQLESDFLDEFINLCRDMRVYHLVLVFCENIKSHSSTGIRSKISKYQDTYDVLWYRPQLMLIFTVESFIFSINQIVFWPSPSVFLKAQSDAEIWDAEIRLLP